MASKQKILFLPYNFQRLSNIFQPINLVPKGAKIKPDDRISKSQRLMLDLGIIRQSTSGCFHILPLGMRALDKLTAVIDKEMGNIGGQKLMFPSLISQKLWEISGRLEAVSELFTVTDRRNHKYILGPTHEEVASELLSSLKLSYKDFPLRLYQVTNKFRDELKPRFGLMRGRQFLMKDMYSFDINVESAMDTYEAVCESYSRIFTHIGIDFVKVLGSSGTMGGNLSHEFQFQAKIGEDLIFTCASCNYTSNNELVEEKKCPKCGNLESNQLSSGIEVGHTFFLGETYSNPLKAVFTSSNKQFSNLQMGSYGLGLSRIVAAAIEILSEEQEIRWPLVFAPYKLLIIPPKFGSKEEGIGNEALEKVYSSLHSIPNLKDDILVDDRSDLTIGYRFMEAKRFGYPFIVVLGKKLRGNPPLLELNDLSKNVQHYFTDTELYNYLNSQINKVSI